MNTEFEAKTNNVPKGCFAPQEWKLNVAMTQSWREQENRYRKEHDKIMSQIRGG